MHRVSGMCKELSIDKVTNRLIDVRIVLAARQPVPRSLADELSQIVRQHMEQDVVVSVMALQDAWENNDTESTSNVDILSP